MLDPRFVKATLKETRRANPAVWESDTLRTALILRDAARAILAQGGEEYAKAQAIIEQFRAAAAEGGQ